MLLTGVSAAASLCMELKKAISKGSLRTLSKSKVIQSIEQKLTLRKI